jgi:hypothetical protein
MEITPCDALILAQNYIDEMRLPYAVSYGRPRQNGNNYYIDVIARDGPTELRFVLSFDSSGRQTSGHRRENAMAAMEAKRCLDYSMRQHGLSFVS